MTTILNVRVDTKTKREAKKLAAELGISLTTVVNNSLKDFLHARAISLRAPYKMTPYLEKIIEEAEIELAARKTKSFSSMEAMIADLKK